MPSPMRKETLYAPASVIREFPAVLISGDSFIVPPSEQKKRPKEKSDEKSQENHIPQHFVKPPCVFMDAPWIGGVYK